MRQSLILIDCIIVERSYLIDNFEFIRLCRIKIPLLPALSSSLTTVRAARFLYQDELLNRLFYGPTMPHGLYYGIHKAIKLIGLITEQKVKLIVLLLRATLGNVIAALIV